MAKHKERGPARCPREPLRCSSVDYKHSKTTLIRENCKCAQLNALDRLGFYRGDLDAWDRGGRVGPMPSPDRFGLRLNALSSSEVLWRTK